ncbi:MAG TPA: hypothetical protein VF747_11800 [Blastocatellia bacterium]
MIKKIQAIVLACALALSLVFSFGPHAAHTQAAPAGSVVTFADGSLTSPAAAFESSKGTGFYLGSSHIINIASNRTLKLAIGSGITASALVTANSGITLGAGSKLTSDSGTVTATTGAATLSKQSGVITTESLTTAAAAAYTLTLTNTVVTAGSRVFVSVDNGTNSQGIPIVGTVTPSSGQVVIKVFNLHASQALNGTLKISFFAML